MKVEKIIKQGVVIQIIKYDESINVTNGDDMVATIDFDENGDIINHVVKKNGVVCPEVGVINDRQSNIP